MSILPLAGAKLLDVPVRFYTEFPPTTRPVRHAEFSWTAFAFMASLILAVVLPFIVKTVRAQRYVKTAPVRARSFPWWGWAGLAFGVVFWVVAWTRIPWLSGIQPFTFGPLWLCYIVVVNALTFMRTGTCMLTKRPFYLAGLFVASACFWWYFEYLNRFVENWYYEGTGELTKLQYLVFATLPFSTVLPAVLGTYDLLASMPRAGAGWDDFLKIRVTHPKLLAWLALVVFGASMGVLGVWRDYVYPLVWVSPLFVMVGWQAAAGQPTVLSPVAEGRWRKICLLALAALICGLFWEMWNYWSYAKWVYQVPLVGRFKLFEMPVLGFAGYLPFGLECAVVAGIISGAEQKARERATIFERSRLRLGAVTALVIGGIALTAATVLGFFGRARWEFQLMSPFRVQYFVALAAIALLLGLARSYRAALVFTAVAIVNLCLVAPLYFGEKTIPDSVGNATAREETRTFRAVLANVCAANREKRAVSVFLLETAADFVVIEEFNAEWMREMEAVFERYPYREVLARNDHFGIALLSKHEFITSGITYFEAADGEGMVVPSVFAEIDAEGQRLFILGTHPVPPAGSSYIRERNEQIDRIPGFLEDVAIPVVLLGDLNSTPWCGVFRDLIEQSGLHNSLRGYGPQGSWPTYYAPMRIPIDHCLVSEDVNVTSRELGPALGSDHFPVIVEFTIRNP